MTLYSLSHTHTHTRLKSYLLRHVNKHAPAAQLRLRPPLSHGGVRAALPSNWRCLTHTCPPDVRETCKRPRQRQTLTVHHVYGVWASSWGITCAKQATQLPSHLLWICVVTQSVYVGCEKHLVFLRKVFWFGGSDGCTATNGLFQINRTAVGRCEQHHLCAQQTKKAKHNNVATD